jgi:Zn-dependent metalloprotease
MSEHSQSIVPPHILEAIAERGSDEQKQMARETLEKSDAVRRREVTPANPPAPGGESIIPPHILDHISEEGDDDQRQWAQDTLAKSQSLRDEAREAPAHEGVAADAPQEKPPAKVAIYDCRNTTDLPGTPARGDTDPATSDVEVNEAHDGLRATLDFYADVLSRNSVDDRGLDLIGSVHYDTKYDNAQWTGSQMLFGDGDGTLFNRFTISMDIMGHELTHGVTQYSAALVYQDQSGALNESVSDCFGVMVKQFHLSQDVSAADWLIGAGILTPQVHGKALRSMADPGTAYDDPVLGKDPQPGHMDHYVQTNDDNGGVHINSGIPNHAFYYAAVGFGGNSWEKAGRIWYATLTDPAIPNDASFEQFAQLTVEHAGTLFDTSAATVVSDAWQQVGIRT